MFNRFNLAARVLAFIFFLFFYFPVSATKFFSASDGNWEDSTVWMNGNPPGYSFDDTVEINHCIFYNQNLQLNAGALLTVADSGKICGHHNFYLKPGAEFDLLGRMYFDSMWVEGYFYINNNRQLWVGQYLIIYGYSDFVFVGPTTLYLSSTFICSCTNDSIPPFPSDTITPTSESFHIDVYPNPFADGVHFKNYTAINFIYLTDDLGRIILRKEIAEEYLDLRHLPPATYFLHFILKDQREVIKKIIKI